MYSIKHVSLLCRGTCR